MEQEFSEFFPVTALDWIFDISEHSSISKDDFLRKLKVTHNESQPLEKNERKQKETKEFKKKRKKKIDFYLSP